MARADGGPIGDEHRTDFRGRSAIGKGVAAIDVAYVAKGRISPVYLADAAIEVAIVAMLLSALNAARGD